MLIRQGLATMHIKATRRASLCYNSSRHRRNPESKAIILVWPSTRPNMLVAIGTLRFWAIYSTSLRCQHPMLTLNGIAMPERSRPAKDSTRSRRSESPDLLAVPMAVTLPQVTRASALTAKAILGHIEDIAHPEVAQATRAATITIPTSLTRTISRGVTVEATESHLARLSNSIRLWSLVVQQVGSMPYWMNFQRLLQQITSVTSKQQQIYFYRLITIITCTRLHISEDQILHTVMDNSGKISSVKSRGTSITSSL